MLTQINELFTIDRWTVREVVLTTEKVDALWKMLQKYKTLFSDLTRGKAEDFVQTITDSNSLWFEVVEYDVIVGVIYFNEMSKVVDCSGHMVFFDRSPSEKVDVCKEMARWMFANFPLHRITVSPPTLYHATVRLLEKIGFKREGTLRQSVLIGGKWNDQAVYGLLRSEV